MELKIKSPSEVGLKTFEVFYNPEKLLIEATQGQSSNNDFMKRTYIAGAIVYSLNCSPQSLNLNPKIKVLKAPVERSFYEDKVNQVERIKEDILKDVNTIVNNNNVSSKNFSDEEINEMEILDAYYNNAKKYYPSKNKIPF